MGSERPTSRGVRRPNQPLQQTGHANNATARHSGFSRVSRLLSWLFGCAPIATETQQRGIAAARFNHPFEDNTMSSGQPEDTANTKREQRQRRMRIIAGLFMLMLGVPPLLNAFGNPRVQALHGAEVLGLIASGLVIGFGLGLLLSKLMFRGG